MFSARTRTNTQINTRTQTHRRPAAVRDNKAGGAAVSQSTTTEKNKASVCVVGLMLSRSPVWTTTGLALLDAWLHTQQLYRIRDTFIGCARAYHTFRFASIMEGWEVCLRGCVCVFVRVMCGPFLSRPVHFPFFYSGAP